MIERRALIALAVASLALAGVYVAVRPREPGPLPDDARSLALRLRSHPVDWRAASALSEHALDSRLPRRIELWRAAHDVAMRLAPEREAPRMSFARGAFFHWTELSEADRRAALDAVAPLLREPRVFFDLARPLFDLTGDLAMLRRWQPGTPETTDLLREIAATNGRFADYRALRDELVQRRTAVFLEKVVRLSAPDIVQALPPRPYDTSEEPMLAAALAELHRRPLTEDPHRPNEVDALVGYALRHRLGPLDGIDAILRIPGSASDLTRLELAHALGMQAKAFDIRMSATAPIVEPKRGEWQNLYVGNVNGRTWVDREMRGAASITIERVESDEVPPYVEVYFDDARVAEGEVAAQRAFALPASEGVRRIEVRVIDPRTRNGKGRVVRVVSVGP